MLTLPVFKHGKVVAMTVLDPADYAWACEYRWNLLSGYATRCALRHERDEDDRRRVVTISLHREILGLKWGDGEVVDHIDRNPLNNRRRNLRVVSRAENAHNRPARTNVTSEYRGVGWDKVRQMWVVRVMVRGQSKYLGHYDDEEEAGAVALAYQAEHMPLYDAGRKGSVTALPGRRTNDYSDACEPFVSVTEPTQRSD